MSKTQQVLDAITANPNQPYAFYQKQLGFPPGFALMTLRSKGKITRTGTPKNYLYGPAGNGELSIAQEVAAIHAAKKKRTKKPAKSVPPKEPGTIEKAMANVPLARVARKGYSAMHDMNMPDALLAAIAVHNALQGKVPDVFLRNIIVIVYTALSQQQS